MVKAAKPMGIFNRQLALAHPANAMRRNRLRLAIAGIQQAGGQFMQLRLPPHKMGVAPQRHPRIRRNHPRRGQFPLRRQRQRFIRRAFPVMVVIMLVTHHLVAANFIAVHIIARNVQGNTGAAANPCCGQWGQGVGHFQRHSGAGAAHIGGDVVQAVVALGKSDQFHHLLRFAAAANLLVVDA